jgi:hypothetical protein
MRRAPGGARTLPGTVVWDKDALEFCNLCDPVNKALNAKRVQRLFPPTKKNVAASASDDDHIELSESSSERKPHRKRASPDPSSASPAPVPAPVPAPEEEDVVSSLVRAALEPSAVFQDMMRRAEQEERAKWDAVFARRCEDAVTEFRQSLEQKRARYEEEVRAEVRDKYKKVAVPRQFFSNLMSQVPGFAGAAAPAPPAASGGAASRPFEPPTIDSLSDLLAASSKAAAQAPGNK